MKIKCVLFMLVASGILANAQEIMVKGKISNPDGIAIPNASIVININKLIKGYGYSNSEGKYAIKLNYLKNNDTLKLSVNSLGYKNSIKIIIYKGEREISQDFVLAEEIEQLNEVVLEAWEKIKIRKDTVTFKANKFMNGSEQVVEDLLKNLPGVEILKNGNIKVNGKFIDKLLIEGDDLFDEKYILLSKNLDAKNISEVQILNSFEDNPVLKSFQESEKVALNLKLKEDKKNVWFGNASAGLGTNSRYTGSANLGLLKKKTKFFNLTSLNNNSKLAVSQVKNNGSITSSSLETENKIEKKNNTIVNIDNISNSNFSNNEDVFNNSFLNSLSFVTSLSNNLKLRNLTYYAFDKIDKQNSNVIKYFTVPEAIEYSERRTVNTKDVILATELELKYYSKDKTYLKYNFSFENNPTRNYGNFFSNSNRIYQTQDDKKHNFFNHLNITKKISKNNLLTIYAYYGLNNTKQHFFSETTDFNEDTSRSYVRQNSNTPLNYTGLIAELITKRKTSEFGILIKGNFEYDKIKSELTLNNQPPIDSLSNTTHYKKTTLSVVGKYSLKLFEGLKLKSSINISQNYTNLNDDKENSLFINPKIGLFYKRKQSGNFGFNYSFTSKLPSIYYLNENYILKNYRTFSKGLENISSVKTHNISFKYLYQNYKKLFLVNSFLLYGFSNSNYGTENLISETFSFSTYKILDGGNSFSFNLGITKYLGNLPISIKLNTNQSWNNNNVIINNSFEKIKNYSSYYHLQGTTYLKIPLNFKFHFQYNYSSARLNNQKTSNNYIETSLNTILELSKTWNVDLNNDYYFLNEKYFLFTNMEVRYNPQKSKWSYMVKANNLFNTNEFSNVYISEYQERSSVFRIMPRYILLSLKYRF